jgi:NTP pyrophosphatase (non-canonical NTP hydrolase)
LQQLPREVLEITRAIRTLESMLDCQHCKVEEELQKLVIMVLTQVSWMETPLALSDEVNKRIDEVVQKRLISSLKTAISSTVATARPP